METAKAKDCGRLVEPAAEGPETQRRAGQAKPHPEYWDTPGGEWLNDQRVKAKVTGGQ